MKIIVYLYILLHILLPIPLIFLSQKISIVLKLFDYPDNKRKLHKSPILMAGGFYFLFIIIFSFLITFIFIQNDNLNFSFDKNYLTLLVVIFLGFFIGIFDDKFNLKALLKLFLVFIIFMFSFVYFDSQFYITNLTFYYNYNVVIDGKLTAFLFTALCFVILINALNMIDGINGLLSTVILCWLIIFSYLLNFESYFFYLNISLILGLLIFSVYNLKSKFFLGDSGCFVLSFYLCYQTVYIYNFGLNSNDQILYVESILLLFLIPGLDMIRLIFERALLKQSPFTADRHHFHHLLISKYSLFWTLLIYLCMVTIPFILYIAFKNILLILLIFTSIIYFLLIIRFKNEKN